MDSAIVNNIDTKKEIDSPFVGLRPFGERDEQYFFGRDDDTEVTATNLRATNITILYGASGVGKSSLINAKILPYLQKMADLSISSGELPKFIPVVLNDWANDPTDSLRNSIEKAAAKYKDAIDKAITEANANSKKAGSTTEDPGKDKDEKKETETKLFGWKNPLKIKFLIILDQFEMFLSDETRSKYKLGEQLFSEELTRILNDDNLPVNIMISLREDALAQLDFLKNKVPDLMKNTLRLEPLDRDGAEATIREPLKKYSEGKNISYGIENKLVKKLLTELEVGYKELGAPEKSITEKNAGEAGAPEDSAESGAGEKSQRNYQVQTPDLQLVMSRLWEETVKSSEEENKKEESTKPGIILKEKKEKKIELETLKILGGVEGIHNSYLDEVMKKSLSEAEILKALKFIHLTVSMSGAKRSSTVEELHFGFKDEEITRQDIKDILDKLTVEGGSYKGIFKKVKNRNEENPFKSYFYEVTHDALVPSIFKWRERENEEVERQAKLKSEEQERLKQEAKLKEQEKRFAEEQQLRLTKERLLAAEKKSRKLGRRVWYLFSILALCIIGLLLFYGKSIINGIANNKSEELANFYSQKYTVDKNSVASAEKSNEVDEVITKNYEKQINNYQSIIKILIELQSENPKTVNEALNQLTNKAKSGEVPEEYKEQFADLLNNKKIAPHDEAKLKLTKEAVKVSVPKIEISRTISPTIIFIQVQNEKDRSDAEKLKNLLNDKGVLAPGVENVGAINLSKIQLRYFSGKYSQQKLDAVFGYLNCIFPDIRLVQIPGYENSSKVRQNQFELWFTSDGIPDFNLAQISKCPAPKN